MVGVWTELLCLANESHERGRLYLAPDLPYDAADIAGELGMEEETLSELLSYFLKLGMISYDDGVYSITNWDSRQFASDDSTERVRRHRERKRQEKERGGEQSERNVTCNGDETFHPQDMKRFGNVSGNEGETDQNRSRTDTDQNRSEQTQKQKQKKNTGAPPPTHEGEPANGDSPSSSPSPSGSSGKENLRERTIALAETVLDPHLVHRELPAKVDHFAHTYGGYANVFNALDMMDSNNPRNRNWAYVEAILVRWQDQKKLEEELAEEDDQLEEEPEPTGPV